MSRTGDVRTRLAVVAGGCLLLLLEESAAACSVCFGDPQQSGPVQAAILLLLGLVALVQIPLARLLWRLLRRSRS